ncbi:hypothetical protein ACQPWY_08110 [Pseudonocardia xinjiangensis]|uniref:hypothetical protein n=1 Tax=Pseudonocardia xinjiangensis TaxID=75289 RepID=UPI003D8A88EB
MSAQRSSRGHVIVVALLGVAAVAHGGLALTTGSAVVAGLSGLLVVAAIALVLVGLLVGAARFGGDREDHWLLACAVTGAVGVASALVVTWLSVSGPGAGGGFDPWSLGVLLIDALAVRVAVFTLRRSPSGTPQRRS